MRGVIALEPDSHRRGSGLRVRDCRALLDPSVCAVRSFTTRQYLPPVPHVSASPAAVACRVPIWSARPQPHGSPGDAGSQQPSPSRARGK